MYTAQVVISTAALFAGVVYSAMHVFQGGYPTQVANNIKTDKEVRIMSIQATASEKVSFHTVISAVDDQNNVTPIVDLVATLDAGAFGLEEQCTVLNKDLYTANAVDVKAQYTNFRNTVITRAQSLGYVIF